MSLGTLLGKAEEWQLLLDAVITPIKHRETVLKEGAASSSGADDHAPSSGADDHAPPPNADDHTPLPSAGDNAPPSSADVEGISPSQSPSPQEELNPLSIVRLLLCWLAPVHVGKVVGDRELLIKDEVRALLVAATSLHTQQRWV